MGWGDGKVTTVTGAMVEPYYNGLGDYKVSLLYMYQELLWMANSN